jgi:hypothetical protein
MSIRLINPEGLYDPSPNAYSQIALVPAGQRLAFISGQGGDNPDGSFGRRGTGNDVMSGDADGAGSGREQSADAADSGGFSGAVGAEEAEDFAGTGGECGVVDG